MTAYTEGPWYIDGHAVMVRKPEREHLGDGAPETICEMISSVSPGETRSNQVLISAAPDLVETLRKLASAAARIIEDDDKPTLQNMRELNRCRQAAVSVIATATAGI